MMRNQIWLVAGLATCFSMSQASGLEEELIVVGDLEATIPMQLARYGNRVEIVTAEQIQVAGFDDLGQALQMLVPGLYLAPKNGAFDYVDCSLQGSRCQDILWLVDGVRINNRLYNTTSPLDTIPAHMVERVEVLYGGQGIFYGTQSVAGVVNVVTRGFVDDMTGEVEVGVDGNEGRHLNGDLRGSVFGGQFVVYASRDEADGFQPFDSSDYQPSGTDRDRGYDVTTLGAKYRVSLGEAARLAVMYHRTDNQVEFAAPSNRARSYNERVEDLVTVKLDYAVRESVDLLVKAYYHEWDSHWTQRDNELDALGNPTGNVLLVSDREFWGYEDYGLMAVADFHGGSAIDFSLGYDHQRFSGRDDVLLIADDTEHVNAVFGQVRTADTLFENSSLAFGLRYNRPSGDGDITVWNFSGQHHFNERLYLRGSLGTSFRFPDAFQLYGNDPCCTLGNPDLEGEESRNVNLGIGGEVSLAQGLHWELVAFARQVDNLIGSASGVRVNSDQEVDFEGLELALSLQVSDGLRLALDYTHTQAEEDGRNEQVIGIPESLFKFNAVYLSDSTPLEWTLAIAAVGDLFDSVSGGIGRLEHGGYTVVDLSAAYYFGRDRQHRVGVRLENALDESYGSSLGRGFRDSDGSSYPYTNLGTPRTWHATYSFRF